MFTGSLRERRPGVWRLRAYLGPDRVTGKHRYVARQVKGGKRDAQRELARFVTDAESLARVKPAAIEAKKMTLTELVDEPIRRHQGAPTTPIAYRSILKTHIAPTIGRLPVVDVDPAILDRFYEHLVNDKKVSSWRPPGARRHSRSAASRRALGLDHNEPGARRGAADGPTRRDGATDNGAGAHGDRRGVRARRDVRDVRAPRGRHRRSPG